jgi:hypothetical protein
MKAPVLFLVLPLLAACSTTAPDCMDERTQSTVLEIVRQKIAAQSSEAAAKKISLSLMNIRTTELNETLGKYTCAADLEFRNPRKSRKLPITYTSELSDGGKNFYVTVHGL